MKKQSGITMVALVVTVIILLILAGISLSIVTGDNGIFKKSRETKLESKRESIMTLLNYKVVDEKTKNPKGTSEEIITSARDYVDNNKNEIEDLGRKRNRCTKCNK